MEHIAKKLLVKRVRSIFHDRTRGERPVERRSDGLFGPASAAWQVHGDVTSMLVGGIAALLLQMLHPAVLAGVWDHSSFRRDMHGRLRRTARFIALTTYGSCDDAEAAIARVRAIHSRVRGSLPDGTPYWAQDPALISWVHATESLSFLDAWLAYAQPDMSVSDQNRYFEEVAVVARKLGATVVPTSRAGMIDYVAGMKPQLCVDSRTREVAKLVLRQSVWAPDALPLELVKRAAVDLLPAWARTMHGLRSSGLGRPLVGGGTLALARTLRWAFQ